MGEIADFEIAKEGDAADSHVVSTGNTAAESGVGTVHGDDTKHNGNQGNAEAGKERQYGTKRER